MSGTIAGVLLFAGGVVVGWLLVPQVILRRIHRKLREAQRTLERAMHERKRTQEILNDTSNIARAGYEEIRRYRRSIANLRPGEMPPGETWDDGD